MTEDRRKGDRRVPPAVAQFAFEQLGRRQATALEVIGYLRASADGAPEWSEDCVCEEAVYPNYDGDESVSMPICRMSDALAVIAQRDARIEDLVAILAQEEDITVVTNKMFRDRIQSLESELAALKAHPSAGVAQGIDIDAAAKALAGCMDYPWDLMPEQGREAMRDHAKSVIDAARLNPCRAQAVQICKLGSYGAAYDAPDTCRAYTYAAQPGNDIAYRLGDCLRAAHCDGGGDFIDFGLALLRRLQDKGFGVFQIAAPSANSEQARSCVTCNGVGIIGHSTLCPECATAPSTQRKESGDE